jgi:hypothetical protein
MRSRCPTDTNTARTTWCRIVRKRPIGSGATKTRGVVSFWLGLTRKTQKEAISIFWIRSRSGVRIKVRCPSAVVKGRMKRMFLFAIALLAVPTQIAAQVGVFCRTPAGDYPAPETAALGNTCIFRDANDLAHYGRYIRLPDHDNPRSKAGGHDFGLPNSTWGLRCSAKCCRRHSVHLPPVRLGGARDQFRYRRGFSRRFSSPRSQ